MIWGCDNKPPHFPHSSPSCNCPDYEKWLLPRRHCFRQERVRRFVRQILLTGEKTHHRAALLGNLVADSPAQHWITGFERIKDRPRCDRAGDLKRHLTADTRQDSQMLWKYDS